MSEQLWQRIQTSLDAGQDPVDDPFLCQSLLANPEQLEDFAELRSGLLSVTAGHAIRVQSETRRSLCAAAAALTFSLLAVLVVLGATRGSTKAAVREGRILELSSELIVERFGQREYESHVSLRDGDELKIGIETATSHRAQLRRWIPAQDVQ